MQLFAETVSRKGLIAVRRVLIFHAAEGIALRKDFYVIGVGQNKQPFRLVRFLIEPHVPFVRNGVYVFFRMRAYAAYGDLKE